MGWHVITFWTCTKITGEKVKGRLERVGVRIRRGRQGNDIGIEGFMDLDAFRKMAVKKLAMVRGQ